MNIFAGAGFAVMAKRLAIHRITPGMPEDLIDIKPRDQAGPYSRAYYAILDRAEHAFRALQASGIRHPITVKL